MIFLSTHNVFGKSLKMVCGIHEANSLALGVQLRICYNYRGYYDEKVPKQSE